MQIFKCYHHETSDLLKNHDGSRGTISDNISKTRNDFYVYSTKVETREDFSDIYAK